MEKPTTKLGVRRESIVPKKVLVRAPEEYEYFDGTQKSPITDAYCAFREAASSVPEIQTVMCCDVQEVYESETGMCVGGRCREDADLALENNPWMLPDNEDTLFGEPVGIDVLTERLEAGKLRLNGANGHTRYDRR